ncbi:MAG TPA: hypothetical protein PLR44_01985 [Thermomicrobiales bacterium]|nr:hypothetical protein [Thermomicrobiales bacterium]
MIRIDRLVFALTAALGIPAIIVAVWLLRDYPVCTWWVAGPLVGGLVGAVIGWVAYGHE